MAMVAAACLPDRLDPAEAQNKADQAQAAKVGCGNAKVEAQEQCDDKAGYCGGCVDCQRRRAWHVKDGNALAVVPNTQVKSIDKVLVDSKSGFSIEFWFRPDKLPIKTSKAPAVHALLLIGVPESSGKSPTFTMAIARDGDKNAWYAFCTYTYTLAVDPQAVAVQAADPLAQGQWHHIRCVLNDKSRKLQLRLDGGAVLESATAVAGLGVKPWFDPLTMGILGAVPLHKEDPGQVFAGALDELRVVTGAPAKEFGPLKYRYVGDEPGTQILYHMDLAPDDRLLADATANGAHAEQASLVAGLVLFSASELESQADGCYGFSAEQALCKATAPWCQK